MYVFKVFLVIILGILLNKFLSILRKNIEYRFKINNMSNSIISRRDLVDLGMDYYLTLCKYIITKKGISREVYIQDITGREIVDIKFVDINNKQVYVSCILKEVYEGDKCDFVTYDEVLDLLNFMVKDGVSKGLLFVNSNIDDRAVKLIESLNLTSTRYNIEVIDGYEIIKFARKRNENLEEKIKYA